jgi:hypothetical protein
VTAAPMPIKSVLHNVAIRRLPGVPNAFDPRQTDGHGRKFADRLDVRMGNAGEYAHP